MFSRRARVSIAISFGFILAFGFLVSYVKARRGADAAPSALSSSEGAPVFVPDDQEQKQDKKAFRFNPLQIKVTPVSGATRPSPGEPPYVSFQAAQRNRGTHLNVLVPPHHIAKAYSVDEDGIAVIDGDIAIGLPPSGETSGLAAVPHLQTWPTRRIPYHIQAHLPDPERILKALQLFDKTAIQFVPYTDEEDALVFEVGEGACKSYVGRVGGKQPIWLSDKCGPREIAHELMHAIGFIHEQNRFDRDAYITLRPEAIDEKFRINFEKMPPAFMALSGLAKFGYDSLMIYPPTMFSRNAQETMIPAQDGRRIQPGDSLSEEDRTRINLYYGPR